jgi:hypothetical protein
MAWGGRQRAMETAQHRARLPKNQPAEITMFQISEVLETHAFNGRRSFLALRHGRLGNRPSNHVSRPRSDWQLPEFRRGVRSTQAVSPLTSADSSSAVIACCQDTPPASA